MIGFIEHLYRNPPVGSICYYHTRAVQCLHGDMLYAVSSFLILVVALIVVFIASVIISAIRSCPCG